jgi:alpha-amylase
VAENLVVYTVVHQPRRLRLPAQVIPSGTPPDDFASFVFDEAMDRRYFEKVAQYAYLPATGMFRDLTKRGWRMSIGFSNSFLVQAEQWGKKVLDSFQRLCASPNVEVVCVEPYHSWLLYLDIVEFKESMLWARRRLEDVFQKPVTVTDTTEMFMSNDVYFALQQCGFSGAFMEGRAWQLGWREPTHVYRYPGQKLALLARHHELSDDVGYRFSNRSWSMWPLMADTYARWLSDTGGDVVTLGWDFETFGEHHPKDSGIFQFVRALNTQYNFDTRQVAIYVGVGAGGLIAVTFVWDLIAARGQSDEEPEVIPAWDPMAGGHPVPPLPGQTLPALTAVGTNSTDDAGTEGDQ